MKMKKFKYYILVAVIVLTTACPSNDDVEKAVPVAGVTIDPGVTDPDVINQDDPTVLKVAVGLSATFKAIITPADATNKAVEWKSDHTAVEINETTGEMYVAAETDDIVTISVKTVEGSFAASRKLRVVGIPALDVILEEAVVIVPAGLKRSLVAIVKPRGASNKNVSWESEKPNIATVNKSTGEVTGVDLGVTKITVTTEDGGHQASCYVRATSPNLLKNGGFEEPAGTNLNLYTNWTVMNNAGGFKTWFDTFYGVEHNMGVNGPNRIDRATADGSGFIEISKVVTGDFGARCGVNSSGGFYQVVDVDEGEEYWVKVDVAFRVNNSANHSIKDNVTMKVLSVDGYARYVEVLSPVQPIYSSGVLRWTDVKVVQGTLTIPAGVKQVRFQMDNRSPMPASNGAHQAPAMLFDECEFRQLPKIPTE
jgi:hypothetical protein